MHTLLIQLYEDTLLTSLESRAVIEGCEAYNWIHNGGFEINYCIPIRDRCFKSIVSASKDYRDATNYIDGGQVDYSKFIPVGSVEYCNYILGKQANRYIKPLNIPIELMKYTDREIKIANNKDDIKDFLSKSKSGKIFIKPNEHCKLFDGTIIDNINQLETEDKSYFMSEYVDFESEWRALVFRGNIVYIANYACNSFSHQYNLDFITNIIKDYTKENGPRSYTIDFGIRANGKMELIELHNFIACGTYGFCDSQLPLMILDGWNYEIKREDNLL